jgi:pimeloyl-ACP methyl ester carboxylesterase
MDEKKITMATLGGHGFGAKVALATAINNMERCTGVINLDGGPLDHRYYEAYQELESYVTVAKKVVDSKMDVSGANKYINDNVSCKKWASIFKQNVLEKNDVATFKFNVDDLVKNMQMRQPDVACWH